MAGALAALPAAAAGIKKLPDPSLAETSPERYWSRIRKEQFLLPEWRAFLNNGSLGVTPRPVLHAMETFLANAAALMVEEYDYPRWGYETLDAERAEMAAFLGCNKDELAFTHNATEAISFLAAGIELKAGDEVVMTDQEHPSGRGPWRLRAKRSGITVREVPIPLPPESPSQLVDLMISAIGPKTRVLFFSGITTTTGLLMPVREICQSARAKGVVTIVDGAHMNGQTPLRLEELGCDYYAGSPHKWLFAPAGCGLLYGRGDALDRIWPSVATGNWEDAGLKAARFMQVGTNNRAIFHGMIAGLRFASAIGHARIYQRIHKLAAMAREQAVASGFPVLTPADDRMYAGLVTLDLPEDIYKRFADLCEQRKIWILRSRRLRISTHVHTRPGDIDIFFETLRDAARTA
jgi:selenocysteine lyase/cysteine desulfurase